MTHDLTSARKAIEAALSHAKQGIAFYTTRVEALETALSQLESVEGEETASAGKGKRKTATDNRQQAGESRGRKPRRAAQAGTASRATSGNGSSATHHGAKRGRKARASSGAGEMEKLPSTGADFWMNLVTEEPQSAVDIANAAVSVLGIRPDQKEQIQKLKQRVAPALTNLVSAQKIQDSGTGRERRFFKGTSAQQS